MSTCACDTLKSWFEASCLKNDDATAISFLRQDLPETVLSFRRMNQDVNRLGLWFFRQGVKKGDRVVLFLEKSLDFVTAFLALQKIGAITVPLNTGFKRSEMAYFIGDTDPKMILCETGKLEIISGLCRQSLVQPIDTGLPYSDSDLFRDGYADGTESKIDIEPSDPALIIYTSGTTGNPKGAVLTHGNLVHNAKNIIDIWEISSSDVLCHALPLFHIHGLCFALTTNLLAGARIVMLDRFAPHTVLSVLSRRSPADACTLFMAVPAMYTKIMDILENQPVDVRHIRLWASGSAPLRVKEFERIRKVFGKEPVEREGMSETGMNFSNPLRGKRKPGSIGIPLPGLEVRIVDPSNFVDVMPGDIGEIWLRSPAITPGYWRKPQETADTFVDGWFRTGDLGKVDEDGYYYLTDRIKHIIITGGENVSAKEVEAVIRRISGVADAAVVGIPDEAWGEKVVDAVVAEPGADVSVEVIRTVCKESLHNWKCPKEILFATEIPKNVMGKVLKNSVARMFSESEVVKP